MDVGVNPKDKKGPFGRPLSETNEVEGKAPKKLKKSLPIYDTDTDGGKQVIYHLLDRNRYKLLLSCTSEIFNGTKREILRYVPGYESLHEKELFEAGYPKEPKDRGEEPPVTFTRGVLSVPTDNPLLIEFLDRHNGNEGNPHRIGKRPPLFRRYDVAKEEVENLTRSTDRYHAMKYAMECDTDELYARAWSLGVNIKRSEERVRSSLVKIAEETPAKLLKLKDSPSAEANYAVYIGIEKDVLEVRNGAIYWKGNPESAPILLIPPGVDAVTFTGKWAVADEKGKVFLSALEPMLS